INSQKPPASKHLFHPPAEKVNSQAVEEHVKRRRRRMQKLEREQLPDLTMQESLSRESEMSIQIDLAIEKQHALHKESDDQNDNQPRGVVRRVIRLPHVKAVADSHGWTIKKLRSKDNLI